MARDVAYRDPARSLRLAHNNGARLARYWFADSGMVSPDGPSMHESCIDNGVILIRSDRFRLTVVVDEALVVRKLAGDFANRVVDAG